MTRVALYARVSSDRQAQQKTISSQLAALHELAAMEGHTVLPDDCFVDEGFSGATLARPALERLRDRVAEGRFELVYVHSPDRLARRLAWQALLLEEFASQGVALHFVVGARGQSAEDALLTQVQGMLAEYERARIAERNRRGKLHKARCNIVNVLVRAPYGYSYVCKTDATDAAFVVDPTEAAVVRRLFDGFVNEQKSLRAIAREFDAEGVPTRRQKGGWHASVLRQMLRNPAYMGRAAYNRTEWFERKPPLRPRRGAATMPRLVRSTHRERPREQWIHIDVPALVTSDLFEAAQEQLARNKRLGPRHARPGRYLLQGLVQCALCHYAFSGWTVRSRRGRHYSYYRCGGGPARAEHSVGCPNKPVRCDPLDAAVWTKVRGLLLDPQRVFEEWSRRADAAEADDGLRRERDEATRSLATIERGRQRLVDAYEAGLLERSELEARATRLRARLERARKLLEDAERRCAEAGTLRALIGRVEDFAARVRAGLDTLDFNARQRLVRTLVARVELDLDAATIVYRVPSISPTSGAPMADPHPERGAGSGIFRLRSDRTVHQPGESA